MPFEKWPSGARKVGDLVGEIAAASNEQAQGHRADQQSDHGNGSGHPEELPPVPRNPPRSRKRMNAQAEQ